MGLHVTADGTIQRLVARLPDPDDPNTLPEDGDGYAMDYDYDRQIDIAPPSPDNIFEVAADELPACLEKGRAHYQLGVISKYADELEEAERQFEDSGCAAAIIRMCPS